MFEKIKSLFHKKSNKDYDWLLEIDSKKRLQIATCALFIEVARADDKFLNIEREKLIQLMKELFKIDDDYVEELIALSNKQVEESLSVYEFTSEINLNCSQEEKYEIVKNLWRLIFVDNELHPYEDFLIRRISNNLHISHRDMIAAKLEVKEELEKKS